MLRNTQRFSKTRPRNYDGNDTGVKGEMLNRRARAVRTEPDQTLYGHMRTCQDIVVSIGGG